MSIAQPLDVLACPLEDIALIEASAGTGKTWAICGLYLRLVLEQAMQVDRILVVTFTTAATAELRDRLRARLADALLYLREGLTAPGETFIAALVAQIEAGGVERKAQCERLELALEAFDAAAVFTIPGFCQRALADAPFSAASPFATEVITDDADLRREVVHDFWRRTFASGVTAPVLVRYLVRRGDTPETFDAIVRQHLKQPLARVLGLPSSGALAPAIDTTALDDAWQQARSIWCAEPGEVQRCLQAGRAQVNGNSYRVEGIAQGADLIEHMFADGEPLALLALVEKHLEHGKWEDDGAKVRLYTSQRLKEAPKKNCQPPSHPFFDQWQQVFEAAAALAGGLRLARRGLIRQLIDDCVPALREVKRSRRVIAFDDMLRELHVALCDEAGDPAAREALAQRLRARYPVALIDEFQDTDPIQFEIFRTLYQGQTGPLFLVGDPKQAIYSFRQADLHTYLGARALAPLTWSIGANQRSADSLIRAVNLLFGAADGAQRGEAVREPFMMEGLAYRWVTPGARRPPVLIDPAGEAAAMQVWQLPSRGAALTKQAALRLSMSAMAAEISRLLRDAQAGRTRIGERTLVPGDIAILVRSHHQGLRAREALAELGIGSVITTRESVYQSVDASELVLVLAAVLEPARIARLCAAFSTDLLGLPASQIAALRSDETLALETTLRFREYADAWRQRGIGFMYRTLLAREGVIGRLLARGDGERRLTNLLHLGDCLQAASREHVSPEALLAWLRHGTRASDGDEMAELRLDSDRNLVQIVTYHKSKGLEYPVVFCPTLWDIASSPAPKRVDGIVSHADDGTQLIDYRDRGDTSAGAAFDPQVARERARMESYAEAIRLAYVGLTRAVHRCYLVVGWGLGARSRVSKPVTCAPLNWLVAGRDLTAAAWFDDKSRPSAEAIASTWRAFADGNAQSIHLRDLDRTPGEHLPPDADDPGRLRALPAPARIPTRWRTGSYSSLSLGSEALMPEARVEEADASDHDAAVALAAPVAVTLAAPDPEYPSAPLAADDILGFPRGTTAGICVHAVMEAADFTQALTWPGAIERALAAHPQTLAGVERSEADRRLPLMLATMLKNVVDMPLPGGVRLAEVPLAERITEWSFWLPAPEFTDRALNEALALPDYPGPRLTFGQFRGYLRGFVDIVYRHGGRYWIADWKSNYLGASPIDYRQTSMAEAMASHGYHLQYLLYTVALHRMLSRRLVGYDYDQHVGGVHYLFMRGVRPAWVDAASPSPGVYFHRPARAVIERLDRLLQGGHE